MYAFVGDFFWFILIKGMVRIPAQISDQTYMVSSS